MLPSSCFDKTRHTFIILRSILTDRIMALFRCLFQCIGLLALLVAQGSCAASGPRTSPPQGCLVVRGSGTQASEYSTVSAAVAALKSQIATQCIFIYGGNYTEQVSIKYLSGPLVIYGYTEEYVLFILTQQNDMQKSLLTQRPQGGRLQEQRGDHQPLPRLLRCELAGCKFHCFRDGQQRQHLQRQY